MRIGWTKKKVGEIADVKGGKRLPKGKKLISEKTAHPYIRIVDMVEDGLNTENINFIDNETYQKISNYIITSDDVYISIAGTIGLVGLIPNDLSGSNLTENCAKITNFSNELNKKFLVYFLRSPYGKSQIYSKTGGSSQPKLAIYKIKDIIISYPSINVQNKIVSILSAYDNLIGNNSKRIKILEDIIHNIYNDWFVSFHFPGHKNIEFVESELGKIPVNWESRRLSDAIEISPKIKVEKDSEKFYVPMSGLSKNSMIITEFEFRMGNNGSKFQNDDTLFARITPSIEHGKTGFVQFLSNENKVSIGSTEFIVMRSKTLNPYFVYCLARQENLRQHAIKSMTGASGRQRVRKECFDNFFIVNPDEITLSKFEELMRPIFTEIQILHNKNDILREIRDLILPKVISGVIDIENHEIEKERIET